MSCELYIFTEPKCWIRDNFALLTGFFTKLDSFEKQSDDVYLLQTKAQAGSPCRMSCSDSITLRVRP